jgi:hypothetical protein
MNDGARESSGDDDTAHARLARVNELFDQGEANHEQVEAVEREVSHVAREARREKARAEADEKARFEAVKAEIVGKLQPLAQVRKQYASEILGHLHAMRSAHTEISQRSALVYSVLDKDSAVVDEANAYAVALGLRPSAKSLDPELLRMALGVWLTGGRSRPNPTITRDAARPMDLLLAALTNNQTWSAADRAAVARLAIEAYVVATASADVSDWMTPIYEPPSFFKGTPSATRFQHAQALLSALLQNGEK